MKRFFCFLLALWILLFCFSVPVCAQEQGKGDPRLLVIGAGAATSTYLSFLSITITTDAYKRGVYNAEKAQQIFLEIKQLASNLKNQLTKLESIKLSKADEKVVNNFIVILAMIQGYADNAVQYTRTGLKSDYENFQKSKRVTWAELKKVLGVK